MTLLLVALLSIFFIRKSLVPVEALKEGTVQIAGGDFDTKVNVSSNDELGDLAVSFNSMAVKLNKQFKMINVMADIDKAILSSLRTDKIIDTINKLDQRTSDKYYVRLQPLKQIHLYALNGTNPIVYVILFASIAVIILLIACINFMNLSTARSATRAKEDGLRKVVGAERGDVIRQFFGESLVLTVIALLVAILLVNLALPSFNMLAAKQLSFNILKNPTILMGLIAITLLTGIISGS